MKRFPRSHVFLFSIYPAVFLWANNAGQVRAVEVLLPAVMTTAGALAFWLILTSLMGLNRTKASILTSCALVMFFSYGQTRSLVEKLSIAGVNVGSNWYFFPFWCLLGLSILLAVSRLQRSLSSVTRLLSALACALLVVSLVAAGAHLPAASSGRQAPLPRDPIRVAPADPRPRVPTTVDEQGSLPDIYYVILDGYANARTLKRVYNYDNSPIREYLQGQGFTLPTNSRANYSVTKFSLASSLNMTYLNHVSDMVQKGQDENQVTKAMIQQNEVMRFLKHRGYKFVLIGYGWATTSHSPYADHGDYCRGLTEFEIMYIRTTALQPFEWHLTIPSYKKGVECVLDRLTEAYRTPGPKFVFAHVMLPHPPFIFAPKDGSDFTFSLGPNDWRNKKAYVNQVRYLDDKLKHFVHQTLHHSRIEPIIILQGDHGPQSFGEVIGTQVEHVCEKLGILNAYHLPAGGAHLLYDSISPVNSFRLILSHYFGAHYPLLADRSFLIPYPYTCKFVDVSTIVRDHCK